MEERIVEPKRAVIYCREHDGYVDDFVELYKLKKLEHTVVVEDTRDHIEVQFFDEYDVLVDCVVCPQEVP